MYALKKHDEHWRIKILGNKINRVNMITYTFEDVTFTRLIFCL